MLKGFLRFWEWGEPVFVLSQFICWDFRFQAAIENNTNSVCTTDFKDIPNICATKVMEDLCGIFSESEIK